jgi:hypothetical protein
MGQTFTAIVQDDRGAEVDRVVFTIRVADLRVLQAAASRGNLYLPVLLREIVESFCAEQRRLVREAGR